MHRQAYLVWSFCPGFWSPTTIPCLVSVRLWTTVGFANCQSVAGWLLQFRFKYHAQENSKWINCWLNNDRLVTRTPHNWPLISLYLPFTIICYQTISWYLPFAIVCYRNIYRFLLKFYCMISKIYRLFSLSCIIFYFNLSKGAGLDSRLDHLRYYYYQN